MKPYLLISAALTCAVLALYSAYQNFAFILAMVLMGLSAVLFYKGIPGNSTLVWTVRFFLSLIYLGMFALVIIGVIQGLTPLYGDPERIPVFHGQIRHVDMRDAGERDSATHVRFTLADELLDFRLHATNFSTPGNAPFKRLQQGDAVAVWCLPDLSRMLCHVRQLAHKGDIVLQLADFNATRRANRLKNRLVSYALIGSGLFGLSICLAVFLRNYPRIPETRRPAPFSFLFTASNRRADKRQPALKTRRGDLVGILVGIAVILPLLAVLVVVLWIDHFLSQVFHLSGVYLILFTLLGTGIFLLWGRRFIKGIFLRLLILPGTMIYLGAIVYAAILGLNVLLPPQSETVYEGRIQEKIFKPRRGRNFSDRYYIELDTLDEYGLNLRFPVSENTYQKLHHGQFYRRRMTRGGLGFAYHLCFRGSRDGFGFVYRSCWWNWN